MLRLRQGLVRLAMQFMMAVGEAPRQPAISGKRNSEQSRVERPSGCRSWYTNCAHAASAYDVLIRRLQRRWNGSASKSTRASTNNAITEEREGAIREYIDRLDKINMCARPQMIALRIAWLVTNG